MPNGHTLSTLPGYRLLLASCTSMAFIVTNFHRPARGIRAHAMRTLASVASAAWIAACNLSDEVPAELKPAPGTVVTYSVANNVRCKNLLEPYPAADGKPGGDQCVSDHVLHEICKMAAHCEQKPFVQKKGRFK